MRRLTAAVCVLFFVCSALGPNTSGQGGPLSFVAAGVTTEVALDKADEVGTHLIQQAGQTASLVSSKVARDLQLLIENARQQLHDELNDQWDRLDSQKLDMLKEIDKYIAQLNAGMERGGAIEENAYLDLADLAGKLPFSEKEPILRTIKGVTLYSREKSGFYRVSLKGNIFNQQYGEINVFRGDISDKTKKQTFEGGVKVTPGASGYDANLIRFSSVQERFQRRTVGLCTRNYQIKVPVFRFF